MAREGGKAMDVKASLVSFIEEVAATASSNMKHFVAALFINLLIVANVALILVTIHVARGLFERGLEHSLLKGGAGTVSSGPVGNDGNTSKVP